MEMEEKLINRLRFNAAYMAECADGGHLGSALGIAPTLYTLYAKHMKVVPNDDKNILRDRFVLSSGHSCCILYAILNAIGFDISVNDLKNFRNIRGNTPGHPNIKLTKGIDCTTGALGQGVANAVGMAIGEKMLAERVNNEHYKLIDNYTYVVAGDGCLMEGVSYEALSLAGSLKLNKLIVIYDYNKHTIDGDLSGVFNINPKLFAKSLGFNVIEVEDGNNLKQIDDALIEAKKSEDKPVFIIVNTIMGYGSHLEGCEKSHAGSLGQDGVAYLKNKLNVQGEPFEFDKNEKDLLKDIKKRFKLVSDQFDERIKYYKKNLKENYEIFENFMAKNKLDIDFVRSLQPDKEYNEIRDYSGQILKLIADKDEFIVGGSADVSFSARTRLGKYNVKDGFKNRCINYGIREFAMSGISNGLALYGFKPFCSTYLSFSDYMRSAIRLSSIMNLPVKYIFTNDGVSSGEDGSTHHAIDHIASLRVIPGLNVYRPCDFNEMKACYYNAYSDNNPSAIIISKNEVGKYSSDFDKALNGGYIIRMENKMRLDIVVLATGSDIKMAIELAKDLEFHDYGVRVVSVPCFEIFDRQSNEYKEEILPQKALKMSIESGVTIGWDKYVNNGIMIGINDMVPSGKQDDIYETIGFNRKNLLKKALNLLKTRK